MSLISRHLPFASSTTTLQAVSYLFGISLFSISFLVFLNSSVSFVVTDLIGQKDGVGDVVGTLGFADEIVALVACPVWGLVSDRLGVRWVALIGYLTISASLAVFVQARNVYPQLLLARIFFAFGATAAATMVTAILPSLTDESDEQAAAAISRNPKPRHAPRRRTARNSIAASVESVASEATITPELYNRTVSSVPDHDDNEESGAERACEDRKLGRPSALAGYVGVFTGCGALVALSVFLPLPARFGEWEGVSTGQAVEYSFYVVALVSLVVGILVFLGLRGLNGEEGKGWSTLLRVKRGVDSPASSVTEGDLEDARQSRPVLPYLDLLRESVKLGFTDSNIALGYIGGFVARASTVAISLFLPLYINTYFISHGFCHGSPHDPSPELKKECRAAYILASILSGVAQLVGLVCAPLFGYLSSRTRRTNYPVYVASAVGIASYSMFPRLQSPEIKDVDGRGGGPFVFLLVSLMGVSQIGAIVCSLGSLGRGVLSADDSSPSTRAGSAGRIASSQPRGEAGPNGNVEPDEADENTTLLSGGNDYFHDADDNVYESANGGGGARVNRVRLKGSIAGVYSWYGGAAILLLAKLGGYLFDEVGPGAPFYMMAVFNLVWLLASFGIDMAREFRDRD